jgi:hypothetical protein
MSTPSVAYRLACLQRGLTRAHRAAEGIVARLAPLRQHPTCWEVGVPSMVAARELAEWLHFSLEGLERLLAELDR